MLQMTLRWKNNPGKSVLIGEFVRCLWTPSNTKQPEMEHGRNVVLAQVPVFGLDCQ